MKVRATITGNLTKDAENIVSKTNKKFCRFSVAVNLTKEKVIFVDCLLNTHLSENKLGLFIKGTLCTFVGRYSEEAKEKDQIMYLNRTLHISDFYASKIKSPFYQNMSIVLVGYLFFPPKTENGKTTFPVLERSFEAYEREENKLFLCELDYTLSDRMLEKMQVRDTLIFIYGYYDDDIRLFPRGDIHSTRKVKIKDFEVLDQPIMQIYNRC